MTLLVHKIHSPQEWEALQALTVGDSPPVQLLVFFVSTLIQHGIVGVLLCAGVGGVYEELWEKVSQ